MFQTELHSNIKSQNGQKEQVHHTDNPSHKKQWENAIHKMDSMFDSYIDPFDTSNAPNKLVNIATSEIATTEVQKSMVAYITKGQEMASKFISERLVRNDRHSEPQTSFYYHYLRVE